jgi:hypothetical protein
MPEIMTPSIGFLELRKPINTLCGQYEELNQVAHIVTIGLHKSK